MTNNYLKKLGKRKANTHGRCGSKKEKRLASKGVRKENKKITGGSIMSHLTREVKND